VEIFLVDIYVNECELVEFSLSVHVTVTIISETSQHTVWKQRACLECCIAK
jgi:hypothetical protein